MLAMGDVVDIFHEETSNPEWKNWLWCESKVTGISGWIPKQYLDIVENTGVANRDYSAVELQVEEGECLEVIFSLNGWLWCENAAGSKGWLPEENLDP